MPEACGQLSRGQRPVENILRPASPTRSSSPTPRTQARTGPSAGGLPCSANRCSRCPATRIPRCWPWAPWPSAPPARRRSDRCTPGRAPAVPWGRPAARSPGICPGKCFDVAAGRPAPRCSADVPQPPEPGLTFSPCPSTGTENRTARFRPSAKPCPTCGRVPWGGSGSPPRSCSSPSDWQPHGANR